jgi:hypothetical protein
MPLKPHPTDPDKVVYVRREYDLSAKPLTREEWLTYLDTTWKKCLADAWQKEWDEMSREDIIRMAREAGLGFLFEDHLLVYGELERFAALVAAAEREACAKLVEPTEDHRREAQYYIGGEEGVELLDNQAEAIRARGQV